MQDGMDPTVRGKTLKKIGESLGRFADTRATAKEPRDRVVVQADTETLKVVAGASYGTIIATVHATTQQFRAVISARELLTTIKTINPKQEYIFEDLDKGWEVGCSLGSTDFLRLEKKLPAFILPPGPADQSQGYVDIGAEQLEVMGTMLVATADDIYGSPVNVAGRIHTQNDMVQFNSTNNIRLSAIKIKGDYPLYGTFNGELIEAARAIGDARMEFWTGDMVTLINDMYRIVGKYKTLNRYGPLSFKEGQPLKIEYRSVEDRIKLVKSIREQAGLDSRGRVMLQYSDNALKVLPFDAAKAGWYAVSENLLKVLTATKVKQVGIGLRTERGQPINVRIPEWTIEVAPVELTPPK